MTVRLGTAYGVGVVASLGVGRWRNLLLLTCGSLVACGYSSDSSAPTSDNPAGYYTGTWVSPVSGSTIDVVALAADTGELRVFSTGTHVQFVMKMEFGSNELAPELTGYAAPGSSFPDGTHVCTGNVNGRFQPGATMQGDFDCGGARGSFTLLYDVYASLQSPASRFPVIGARGDVGGRILFLAVADNGALNGSDSSGCDYGGSLAVIDPFIDVYQISLNQLCGVTVQSFAGLATFGFMPDGTTQALVFAASFGGESLAGELAYQ